MILLHYAISYKDILMENKKTITKVRFYFYFTFNEGFFQER